MNKNKLLALLKQEEGVKLDFKFKINLLTDSDKKEFVKDVIAMANSDGGKGYILFGVEDKTKRLVGIKDVPKNIEERIQQIVSSRSMPPVPVDFELIDVGKRQVGALTILKSRQIPHQMRDNGAFYVRRGSTTDIAMRHEIAAMLQMQGILSFETIPCRQATLEDLDLKVIEKNLGKYPIYNYHKDQLLRVLGIISEYEEKVYPTYGGLLLFGKLPQFFMPQATLRVEYQGRSFGVSGNITNMLESFEEKVKPLLPPQYPFEALKEVVANAVIHRDYWNMYDYTEAIIKPEKIEVLNPSPYDYRMGNNTKIVRFNPWLYARLLLLLQEYEKTSHFGIGLSQVKELVKDKGEIRTTLEDGTFKVILPGTNAYRDVE